MLIDASSYKNLEILGLLASFEELETVTQVAEEIGGTNKFRRVHEVSKIELDKLLGYLKVIAVQTDRVISVELEKNREHSLTYTFNPKGLRGKISIHYGELYLLARAISVPDVVLCDNEDLFHIRNFLVGICGINLYIVRTIEHLHFMFLSEEISASEFTKLFEKMINSRLLYIRIPPKSIKDEAVMKVLLDFMYRLSEIHNRGLNL